MLSFADAATRNEKQPEKSPEIRELFLLSILAKREKFQVFTPENIIQSMLDLAGYTTSLAGKRILENSFGDGGFLLAIAERHIRDSLRQGFTKNDIRQQLEADVVGYEIDLALLNRARRALDALAESYGITGVSWDLRLKDVLLDCTDEAFSFIVGNPPYLECKMLDQDYREVIRESYSTCGSGKFDYCYAFIENSINKLKEDGVLVQIVPNSIFKNKSATLLRDCLVSGLEVVVDYAQCGVFPEVLVSPCVFRFAADVNCEAFSYYEAKSQSCRVVEKNRLRADKWVFDAAAPPPKGSLEFVEFGSKYKASSPVATLCNEAFIVESGQFESTIVKRAASPRTEASRKSVEIIFPYRIGGEGEVGRLEESIFAEAHPDVFAYLLARRSRLESRSADASAKWYEYGRSQGLCYVGRKKLLMSTVVTDNVNVYVLDEDVVPFAGIVVTADDSRSLWRAKEILESDDFRNYALSVGTKIGGSSVRITCSDVNSYQYFATD